MTQAELSIGFIPIERAFWNSLIAYAKKKILKYFIALWKWNAAEYLNVTGIGDLSETVRVILDKVVQEISQEIQSSSTPVAVCEWDGKMRLNTTFLNNNLSFT